LVLDDVQITSTEIFLRPATFFMSSFYASGNAAETGQFVEIRWAWDKTYLVLNPDGEQQYSAFITTLDFDKILLWDARVDDQITLLSPFKIAVARETPTAVPEPSSLAIGTALFGSVGVMAATRRRRVSYSLPPSRFASVSNWT
jgi:hypothetical protein